MEKPQSMNFRPNDDDWKIILLIIAKYPHFNLANALRESLRAWLREQEDKR